jgi:hypothetical protein
LAELIKPADLFVYLRLCRKLNGESSLGEVELLWRLVLMSINADYDRAIEQIEKLLKKGDRISAEEDHLLDLLFGIFKRKPLA